MSNGRVIPASEVSSDQMHQNSNETNNVGITFAAEGGRNYHAEILYNKDEEFASYIAFQGVENLTEDMGLTVDLFPSMGIMATGCGKAVSGYKRVKRKLASVSQQDLNHVTCLKSTNKFRFRNGKSFLSRVIWKMPLYIG